MAFKDKNFTAIPGWGYYVHAKEKKNWNSGSLKYSLDFIKARFLEGEANSILEIGCGSGEILGFLPRGIKYCGLDPTAFCMEDLRVKFPGYNFVIGCAEELPFQDNFFDLIFSVNALEHFFDPRKGLEEMMRAVRPGGYIIISCPNLECPWATIHGTRHYPRLKKLALTLLKFGDLLARFLGALPFRTIKENYTEATGKYERSDDDLKYIVSAYEVAALFQKNGFSIIHTKRADYQLDSLKNLVKFLLAKLPPLQYYGSEMFFIFRKPCH